MSRLSFLLIFFVAALRVPAQNLVPNPGFEHYHACPQKLAIPSQSISLWCDNWYTPTNGTTDYFNICDTAFGEAATPTNKLGYQLPADGVAYAGILTFTNFTLTPQYREYLTTKILPMEVGDVYEVSISVSLAEYSTVASNGLGVFFYNKRGFDTTTSSVLPIKPQVNYDTAGVISDKTNWIRLKAYFKADSAYSNMMIGCFKNDAELNKVVLIPGGELRSYFYVDAVVVRSTKRRIVTYYGDNCMSQGDTIRVPFNVDTVAGAGNIFTAQLSRASDSFKTPIVIGQKKAINSDTITCVIPHHLQLATDYRIRVIASSNVYDTVWDNGSNLTLQYSKPVIKYNYPLCEDSTLTLQVQDSFTADKYTWTGPGGWHSSLVKASISKAALSMTGQYVFSAQTGVCMQYDTALITVNALPQIHFRSNNPVCEKDSLYVLSGVTVPAAQFNWQGPGGFYSTDADIFTSHSTTAQSGSYKLTANNSGCSITDTISILVKPAPQPVAGSNSPLSNGDNLLLQVSNTLPGTAYYWYGPDGFSSHDRSPVIAAVNTLQAGTYTVTTDLDDCRDTSTVVVDISNEADSFYFILYPSPNSGSFAIAGKVHLVQDIPFRVLDYAGRLLYSDRIISIKKAIRANITLPAAASGDYLLHLKADGKKVVIPFTILH